MHFIDWNKLNFFFALNPMGGGGVEGVYKGVNVSN